MAWALMTPHRLRVFVCRGFAVRNQPPSLPTTMDPSPEPSTVPSAVAKRTNASKWPLFKDILGNLDDISRFKEAVDRLDIFLRERRAYYQDARPEVGMMYLISSDPDAKFMHTPR